MTYINNKSEEYFQRLLKTEKSYIKVSTCDYSNWDKELHHTFPQIATLLREKGLHVTSSVNHGVTDWIITKTEAFFKTIKEEKPQTNKDASTIEENNILIAEFMGFKYELKNHYGTTILQNPLNKKAYGKSSLKFHESWNWLMEVADKIESLNKHYRVLITPEYVSVNEKHSAIYLVNIYSEEYMTKKKAAYHCFIEFIKKYNISINNLNKYKQL